MSKIPQNIYIVSFPITIKNYALYRNKSGTIKQAPMDFSAFSPCFLVAMPELADPNFHKSVIMLTDYNKEGARGFIINKKTDILLGATVVLSEGTLNSDYEKLPLFFGGPVEPDKIWITYDSKIYTHDDDTIVGDNIMIARDIDILTNHENTLNTERMRIFHGYTGWGAKQLDAEIAASSWLTSPLSIKLLLDTPQELIWDNAIRNLGFDPNHLIGSKSAFLN